MLYSRLPGTDLKISKICLGTMTFGSPVAEPDAVRLVHYAHDKGINFIDTANMYEGYNRYAGSHGGVAEEILYRLYHEEEVRLFEPQAVTFRCTCSRERSENALLQVGEQEVKAMIHELGEIDMHCDYCGTHYRFDAVDAAAIFAGSRSTPPEQLQ